MGLFARRSNPLQETLQRFETALDDLATCCSNNAEEVRRLKSANEAIEADVHLQWDKVNRALGRMSKREALDEKANGPSNDINERIRRGEPIDGVPGF